MRSDAVRNRQRILEAAEAVFSAEGVSAPIDKVAEQARVGVGTVYRHFPTKEDLFEAIVVTRLEDLLALAQAAASAASPGTALFSYLQQFASEASAKHDLLDAMGAAGIDFKARCAEKLEEMKARIGLLLTRAQVAGAVRHDTSVDELIGLVMGTCQAAAQAGLDDDACRRMVGIVCDGIRAPAPPVPIGASARAAPATSGHGEMVGIDGEPVTSLHRTGE
jgi:AcrR family transcriptional regulator